MSREQVVWSKIHPPTPGAIPGVDSSKVPEYENANAIDVGKINNKLSSSKNGFHRLYAPC